MILDCDLRQMNYNFLDRFCNVLSLILWYRVSVDYSPHSQRQYPQHRLKNKCATDLLVKCTLGPLIEPANCQLTQVRSASAAVLKVRKFWGVASVKLNV
jgi:hypothetical protein